MEKEKQYLPIMQKIASLILKSPRFYFTGKINLNHAILSPHMENTVILTSTRFCFTSKNILNQVILSLEKKTL